MRKFLYGILFIVLFVALIYKSPFSAVYNYNKAKNLYASAQYEQSLPYFEKSLFANPKDTLARVYYVLALSKAEPVYSVQQKLYDMSNSKIDDEAKRYAKTQVINLRFKLLEGIDNNFIFNAPMGNDILRWDIDSFPLKVYYENPESVPEYYIKAIEEAHQIWTLRTNFVKFQKTDNAEDADIVIRFRELPQSEMCKGNSCSYTVAYTEPDIDNNKVLNKMYLTFYKTNPNNKNYTNSEIFNTALHETGHTLGIMGHSDNPEDAMYASSDNSSYARLFRSSYNSLSMRDLKTLALLYRIKPTISNNKNLTSENFYYAPLILGDNEVMLQKKIQEYTAYVNKYPQLAAGYINLSGVYTDLGDYQKAHELLFKAQSFAATNDENYIIKYNTAVIYFNQQLYDKALEYAYQAKAVKDDKNINDFIEEIINLKS